MLAGSIRVDNGLVIKKFRTVYCLAMHWPNAAAHRVCAMCSGTHFLKFAITFAMLFLPQELRAVFVTQFSAQPPRSML